MTRIRLGLLAIPLLSTTFAYVGGHLIGHPAPIAVFGLVWGIGAMLIAPRLARRGACSSGQANAPLYLMLPLTFVALGAAIIVHLLGPTPAAFLQLVVQPGYGLYFAAVHTSFEWVLMPWALMANWLHPTRRRLLIVAAALFYLGRLASATYFAPTAFDWAQNPAAAAAHLDNVAQWMRLDLLRLIVQDTATAALISAAALRGVRSGPVLGGAVVEHQPGV